MHFAHILQSNSKCWHWDNRKIPASYVDMQNQLMQCWIQTNMAILGASMNINAFMMIMMTSCNGKGFPISYHLGSHGLPDTKGPVTWSSSVLFDVSLNTGWTNSRVDGDLKGRGTHVTSHQHRFLFRLSDGVIGNARRNLTKSCVTSHVNVELKGHTCRGSSSILPICSAET